MKTLKQKFKKVLLLGSGALKIGQAGEFDYSGSQAIKSLKEEGIKVVLVNPNIATIQTSEGLADKVYFLPVTNDFVAKIIKKERPDGILLGFGGQTALNCGIELYRKKILQKYNVQVLGTSVSTIMETEDRKLFVNKVKNLGLVTPRSIVVTSVRQGVKACEQIGLPCVLRGGFALGGAGSAVIGRKSTMKEYLFKALSASPQVLVEEYLGGWKEIEYEVVRDKFDNCVTVCNMENMDPMGIHTGESIVVAPSQTLTNFEYFELRRLAITCIRGLGIVGECNIQFALNPAKFEYRIIEVNARLSRSSALASKATGYPLAYVAAKLALGHNLRNIKNSITKVTSAFFEPALDYIVAKIPRWDMSKFAMEDDVIGTEMKSVGEVMAIGRTFTETIQKGVRSLNLNFEGIIPEEKVINSYSRQEILNFLKTPKIGRLNFLAMALIKGVSIEKLHKITSIDKWFLYGIKEVVNCYFQIKNNSLTALLLKKAKSLGFSDRQIANLKHLSWQEVRKMRKQHKIIPYVKQIDTMAGEFPAKTNYLYLTYQGDKDDIKAIEGKNVAVLGSGPYQIGSSVEFDWCAVSTVSELKKMRVKTTVINCNPETVSTDYDISDRLYFEELTLERILDIYDKEKFSGLILSMGGQVPNNLAKQLKGEKLPILGTSSHHIDRAEDRNKFSRLLDKLKIAQPDWVSVTSRRKALGFAARMGYPLLLRPSYVLSGTAMRVVYNQHDLFSALSKIIVGLKHPLVISQFITGATELEVDAVASRGRLVALVVLKHIEDAGVHSGDASVVLSKDAVVGKIYSRCEEIVRLICHNLNISGPFNIQFLVKDNRVMVIECNLRASRSFPFSSKVCGTNLINLATQAIVGSKLKTIGRIIPRKVGVKTAQFSFNRLRGVDPILQIEMASTGEVACFGDDTEEAYLKAQLSVGVNIPQKSVLITIGNAFKKDFISECRMLYKLGFRLYATRGTAKFLELSKIKTVLVRKGYEGGRLNTIELIKRQAVDLVVNIRDAEATNGMFKTVSKERSDGYLIRRAAADHNIPLITNLKSAKLFVSAIYNKKNKDLKVFHWKEYL